MEESLTHTSLLREHVSLSRVKHKWVLSNGAFLIALRAKRLVFQSGVLCRFLQARWEWSPQLSERSSPGHGRSAGHGAASRGGQRRERGAVRGRPGGWHWPSTHRLPRPGAASCPCSKAAPSVTFVSKYWHRFCKRLPNGFGAIDPVLFARGWVNKPQPALCVSLTWRRLEGLLPPVGVSLPLSDWDKIGSWAMCY